MIDISGYLTDKFYSGSPLTITSLTRSVFSVPAKRSSIFLYEIPNKANSPFVRLSVVIITLCTESSVCQSLTYLYIYTFIRMSIKWVKDHLFRRAIVMFVQMSLKIEQS